LFQGQGKLTLNNGTYYNGIWEKGFFKQGDGLYDNGIYTGKWKYIKMDGKAMPLPIETSDPKATPTAKVQNQKNSTIVFSLLGAALTPWSSLSENSYYVKKYSPRKANNKFPVPHGKGVLVKENGEKFTGKWKNGEFIPEKLKEVKK
jgi:hypothetical protein